jgi:hypothetical protein
MVKVVGHAKFQTVGQSPVLVRLEPGVEPTSHV